MENRDNGFTDPSQPLSEIIKLQHLPMVLKYDPSQEVDPQLVNSEFDSKDKLLLHSTHTVQRVHGRCVDFDPKTKCFEDTGLAVSVDENYPGWFAVYGNATDYASDPVVPHFRKISQLAISPCVKFLVSGAEPLEAMKMVNVSNKDKGVTPVLVQPGSVLTKEGMFIVTTRIKVRKYLFQKKVTREEMHLLCVDEQNEEILIPCHAQGIFYTLVQASTPVKIPVMKMSEIIRSSKFPMSTLVKLVHGPTHRIPEACKGTFVLMTSKPAEIGLASNLSTQQPKLYEIEADASVRFFASKIDIDFENENDHYSKVFLYCCEKEPDLFQSIRIRSGEGGIASARSSSSMSGHDSGLSNEEDKYDWSTVNFLCTAFFLEPVDCSVENNYLHHTIKTASPTSHARSSQVKDKNVKVKMKKIKRTKMYDAPPVGIRFGETVRVKVKERDSRNISDSPKAPDYQNETVESGSSSPVSSPRQSDTLAKEYDRVWNDTSSDVSGDSLDVEVENVTISNVPAEDINACRECAAGDEAELQQNGTYVNTSLLDGYEHVYNLLSNTYYSRQGHYCTVDETGEGDATIRSSNSNVYDDAQEPQHVYHSADPHASLRIASGFYEYPDQVREATLRYEHPTDSVTSDYEEPEGECRYERTDSIFISNVARLLARDQTESSASNPVPAAPENYVNGSWNAVATPGMSGSGATVGQQNYVDVGHKVSDPLKMNNSGSGVKDASLPSATTLGTARAQSDSVNADPKHGFGCNTVIEKLISNVKGLGLKPATREAIEKINVQELESSLGDEEFKVRLGEILPGVNKIDLNKISLFIEGHLRS